MWHDFFLFFRTSKRPFYSNRLLYYEKKHFARICDCKQTEKWQSGKKHIQRAMRRHSCDWAEEKSGTHTQNRKEESRSDVKINDGQFCNLCYPHESFMRGFRTVCKFSYLRFTILFLFHFPYVLVCILLLPSKFVVSIWLGFCLSLSVALLTTPASIHRLNTMTQMLFQWYSEPWAWTTLRWLAANR